MYYRLRKRIALIAFTQLFIMILSLIMYHNISILSYINISFYISSALLLTSLLVYTIQSGFFDTISKSFNLAFSKGDKNRKFHEIPGISELITFDNKPLFFYGFVNFLLMLIALAFYYL
ncbi:DUF3899 domain-containing protein [Bacillus thermocopriae]|uniref:DUF3899 domain-containing protein n=2 Tax=Neobacillus thermocopriae TaxID=1215031 RepID=A0A6B3TPF9_9BACI|nr:DUF3899 domain-containing protein [Neobacillus thermocopriae]